MRTILFILRKEFRQVFRNRTMLPMIFLMPVFQLIILAYAATLDMKEIRMFVVDKDLTSVSRDIVNKFQASTFYQVYNSSFSLEEGENQLKNDNAHIVLHIPQGFERKLLKENNGEIQLLINAINGTVAGLTNAYTNAILLEYNRELRSKWIDINTRQTLSHAGSINIKHRFWYNPELNYKTYMVPGILVILVTVIGVFLSGMNVVREKELGTIEQINVTPIKKYQFIVGKLLPFWIIALFELAFGMIIAKLLFDIPIVGSLWLIFLTASLYLLVALGMGLFISTITNTQQQVMFISWFFLLVFILMSGIFTSTDNMPDWAQIINIFNPIYYFMQTIRMVMLKGSDIIDISRQLISLTIYGIAMLSLSIWRYRKVA